MRVVLQRVTSAKVTVEQNTVGQIDHGLLILIGIAHGDTTEQADWLANKTAELRIFEDENAKMNLSLTDTGGSALVVSQFTLLAECRKGRRPAFTDAAAPVIADQLYEYYANALREKGIRVEQGTFGADMKVSLTNNGPVTIVIDREP
ncbi:D-aminoacyl-tRNA deacylase [Rhodopirellula sp.]|nr:D-aminoacyl-tRNA deacylase [Rubripirellula sp.]MDA7874015.1 D-aminoacyl-tRNA deacylase [Rhodopirellula sp.]MDA8968266.1 D-aminoacyl-tRNA deacylase [bacterium]MDA7904850.1 D-aminoacyl-tRNA deacylase [Rhodopirellula sp.]MDB4423389.1 D-aminoacyl-tRNA deacylase [Rhodopirellula sp.]MDB4477461.1 D-aminoacyl-tRNA deacylase [Rhodopirellula sp.]